MSGRVVVDTSVFVAALNGGRGASREVLRLCLAGACVPLMGHKLFCEYEDVMGRAALFAKCLLTERERGELLDAFLSVCEWTEVFYLWRPNLRDEGDNHVVELAVAGGATSIVTSNVRDFRAGDLEFPQLRVETPSEFCKRWRTDHGNDDH